MNIDSGACDTAISPKMGKAFRIQESEMSRSNARYSAANGTQIKKREYKIKHTTYMKTRSDVTKYIVQLTIYLEHHSMF